MTTPDERAKAIVGATMGLAPAAHPDLYSTLVHAEAARRRSADAQSAVARAQVEAVPSRATAVTAVGDAGEALVELYLAASAAKRYQARSGENLPLDPDELAQVLEISRHGRDAVMHWDEKMSRDPGTFIAPGDPEVFVLAPSGKTGNNRVVAGIAWARLDEVASRLSEWAGAKVPERIIQL